jgi:hypothetical protein
VHVACSGWTSRHYSTAIRSGQGAILRFVHDGRANEKGRPEGRPRPLSAGDADTL